jgi:hypothetical protein
MPRRRRVRYVYVRRSRRRGKARLPLLPLIGLSVGAADGVYRALDGNWSNAKEHPDWVLNGLSEGLLGYDFINKQTTFTNAFITYGLTLVGYIAHKFLNMMGVNRHMPDRIAL